MKCFKRIIALMSMLCILGTLVGCNLNMSGNMQSAEQSESSQSKEDSSIMDSSGANLETCIISAVFPKEDQEIVLANDRINEWANAYTSLDLMCSSGQYNPEKSDNFAPQRVDLVWDVSVHTRNYTVRVATDELLKNVQSYKTTQTTLTLKNLLVATQYFWQVETTFNGETIVSDVYSFKTSATRRTIEVEGVSNTRDLGGLMTSSGVRMKQGMVYRGASLNNVTVDGSAVMRKDLKIKTVLDLRSPTTETGGAKVSPLGQSINYINVDATNVYYQNIFSKTSVIKAEIKVFTQPKNYPIYFHCAVGRDRTGSLAYLLSALCGVDEIELYKDYEMTFFSDSGCSDVHNSDRLNDLVTSFHAMNTYMKENFEGKTLQEKTENYLLSIGITAEEIATIRQMLL